MARSDGAVRGAINANPVHMSPDPVNQDATPHRSATIPAINVPNGIRPRKANE